MPVETFENIDEVDDFAALADVGSTASIAIQSQYAHAPRIRALAEIFREQLDAADDLGHVVEGIADPRTAVGTYLDWWGERVGVDRLLKVDDKYHRFDDDYFRFLIQYRALANISNATVATMNRMLTTLTDANVFVVDYQDMSIQSIVIIGAIPDLQAQILQTYGLLNRPAGVLTNFLIIYPDEQIFGFDGQDLLPFNQGVFNPGRTVGME